MSADGRFSLDKTGTIVLVVTEIAAQFGDGTMHKLLATTVLAIIGGIALSVPASATDLTFTVQGTVTSFIESTTPMGSGPAPIWPETL